MSFKVGLLFLHLDVQGKVSGAVTAPLEMYKLLRNGICDDLELNLVSVNGSGRKLKGYPDLDIDIINYRSWGDSLESYDLIVLANIGSGLLDKYRLDILDNVIRSDTPYMFVTHGPHEWKEDSEFIKTICRGKKFSGMIATDAPIMEDMVANWEGFSSVNKFVYPNRDLSFISDLGSKSNSIISVSRQIPNYGQLELCKLAEEITSIGTSVEVIGVGRIYSYRTQCEEAGGEHVKFNPEGFSYEERNSIYDKARYVWCYSYYKRLKNCRVMFSVVIEAISRGCIPVMTKQALPEGMVDMENCLTYDIESPSSLLGKMRDLNSSESRRLEIIGNAMELVRSRYNDPSYSSRLLAWMRSSCF